ncbi:MAG: methyltransferase, partial [Chloroflexota bacterium]
AVAGRPVLAAHPVPTKQTEQTGDDKVQPSTGKFRLTERSPDDRAWRPTNTIVRGRSWTTFEKVGLAGNRERDRATELLAENIEVGRSDRALVLNCGSGLVGAVAATLATDGQVVLADASLVAVEAARRTLAELGVGNAEIFHSAGASHLPRPRVFDLAVVRMPKGRRPTTQLIWDAFRLLRPGGRFYLAGANDEGIQSAFERARQLFGSCRLVEYRGGCRVGRAIKEESPADELTGDFASPLLDHSTFHAFQCDVRGRSYQVRSRPGVFSWEGLDAGSRALIEAMEIGVRDRVLDLGCGTGIVGVVAADLAKAGEVYLVDAQVDAVASTEQTIQANGRPNCVARASDSISAVGQARFDVVVTNPPFHLARGTDYDVASQFIVDAARVLRPSGRLYLVGNRFLTYDDTLRQTFASVRTVLADPRYRVFVAYPRATSTTLA